MAFWGIEVKPGKPFTHTFDRVRGRLHISQATLAIGSSKKTSLVQCNIGNKSPVLLCALLPDKTESLQLNLEFEEADEVVFSVIGPRGVYLTGYYLGHGRHSNLDDDSESYGEDIANTDTEGSIPCTEEDEYEDSFIDDDDPEVLPPSPVSTDGVDEVVDVNKLRDKRCTHKRLKKKYQAVESDDDTSSWQLNTGSCIRSVPESEGEDSFPISSIYKNKRAAKNIILDVGRDKANKERVDTGNRMGEEDDTHAKSENGDAYVAASKREVETLVKDDESKRISEDKAWQGEAKTNNIGQDLVVSNEPDHEPGTNKGSNLPSDSIFPSTELGPANGVKSKRKRKERSKEGRILEADDGNHIKAIEENKSQQANTEADDMDHNLLERSERDQRPNNNMEIGVSADSLLPSMEVSSENVPKKKKRRKEQSVAESREGNGTSSEVLVEDRAKQDEAKTNSMDNDLHERNEQEQKQSNDKKIGIVSERIADENISEKKIKKKKKSKCKIQEDDENVNVDAPILSKEEKQRSIKEFEDKNVDIGSPQARTLSNGLIVEELESGKSDGKAAARGKKLKVLYTAKLKESGQVIDTNIGKAPYRFRLGDQQVVEGWNVGLDGMRVGGKRRLIIPPILMGYGSQGTAENVPPNSWLVYDIELMSVH